MYCFWGLSSLEWNLTSLYSWIILINLRKGYQDAEEKNLDGANG